jgi:hypothetical protein
LDRAKDFYSKDLAALWVNQKDLAVVTVGKDVFNDVVPGFVGC